MILSRHSILIGSFADFTLNLDHVFNRGVGSQCALSGGFWALGRIHRLFSDFTRFIDVINTISHMEEFYYITETRRNHLQALILI